MHACARKTYMHVLITNTTHTKKHTRNGYMRNKWRGPKTTHRYMHYKVENKTWYASRDMTCHPIRFYQPHRLFLEAARISRCFLCLVTHPCTCSVSSDTILRSHTILACDARTPEVWLDGFDGFDGFDLDSLIWICQLNIAYWFDGDCALYWQLVPDRRGSSGLLGDAPLS